jgi:hypothetical protein
MILVSITYAKHFEVGREGIRKLSVLALEYWEDRWPSGKFDHE